MQFGFTLFDERGFLRKRFAKVGNACWGKEVTGKDSNRIPLIYIEEIKVSMDHRGQGLGAWIINQFVTSGDIAKDLHVSKKNALSLLFWDGTNASHPLSPSPEDGLSTRVRLRVADPSPRRGKRRRHGFPIRAAHPLRRKSPTGPFRRTPGAHHQLLPQGAPVVTRCSQLELEC